MTDLTTPKRARAAQQRRDGATRARKWRAAKRDRREPLPRNADAAIVEALSFLIARAARDGVNIERGSSPFDLAELGLMSRLILEREGFDPIASGQLVSQRLRRRDAHTWADFMPSLRPGPAERLRPTRAGDWSSSPAQIVDFMQGSSSTSRSPSRT